MIVYFMLTLVLQQQDTTSTAIYVLHFFGDIISTGKEATFIYIYAHWSYIHLYICTLKPHLFIEWRGSPINTLAPVTTENVIAPSCMIKYELVATGTLPMSDVSCSKDMTELSPLNHRMVHFCFKKPNLFRTPRPVHIHWTLLICLWGCHHLVHL
jgi:hypothetical protein